MRKIQLLNRIAEHGIKAFDAEKYTVGTDITSPEGILVRSANMHETAFGPELLAIARAGAGVNNIPLARCTEQGIAVFNTPGGNANSVKELTVLALLLAARDVVGGIAWARGLSGQADVEKQVEAGKGAFAGSEIQNRWLGVIGLGAVGGLVANIAHELGMHVIGCDPFLSVDSAWGISRGVERAASFQEVFGAVDYLTLHVPSTNDTRGMINAQALSRMRDGVRIINLARADLVVSEDLLAALNSGKVAAYVTDFPTPELLGHEKVISIPHLGASTEEAEDNCALMAAHELMDYLENGNIRNSVNLPNASMPTSGDARLCIIHSNVPSMLAAFTDALGDAGINIENLLNRSRGDIAYTLFEVAGTVPPEVLHRLHSIEGVVRVRLIEAWGRACNLPGFR